MSTKTLLVTGGSRGIGAAVVRAAAGKYNVAFTFNKSEKEARALEAELSEFGGVAAFRCDVSSSCDVSAAAAAIKARFGKVDLLINCAGVALRKLFTETTDDDWRSVFSVNVDGAFYMSRALLPEMISRGEGGIVNVASVWGEIGGSFEVAYSASKAALIGMTRALGKEAGPSGVRVNALSPGAVDTDMMSGFTRGELEELAEGIPLGRLADPDEIARAALFLAECPYATAQVWPINGGFA